MPPHVLYNRLRKTRRLQLLLRPQTQREFGFNRLEANADLLGNRSERGMNAG